MKNPEIHVDDLIDVAGPVDNWILAVRECIPLTDLLIDRRLVFGQTRSLSFARVQSLEASLRSNKPVTPLNILCWLDGGVSS